MINQLSVFSAVSASIARVSRWEKVRPKTDTETEMTGVEVPRMQDDFVNGVVVSYVT